MEHKYTNNDKLIQLYEKPMHKIEINFQVLRTVQFTTKKWNKQKMKQ